MTIAIQPPQLYRLLQSFESHSLSEISNSKLMDRVDTKFLTTVPGLFNLLPHLQNLCSVLEINGRRISKYENVYFDSDLLRFYHDHHNGKLNRFKVRKRTYTEENLTFLEVKYKNNKSRTLKSRIPSRNSPIEESEKFFINKSGVSDHRLFERQKCDYSRISFASEKTAERLTIDFELKFEDIKNSNKIKLNDTVVIELKQSSLNRSSELYKTLTNNQLRPCRFSKYCIGIVLLNKPDIKFNRFKRSLLHMEKISGVPFS